MRLGGVILGVMHRSIQGTASMHPSTALVLDYSGYGWDSRPWTAGDGSIAFANGDKSGFAVLRRNLAPFRPPWAQFRCSDHVTATSPARGRKPGPTAPVHVAPSPTASRGWDVGKPIGKGVGVSAGLVDVLSPGLVAGPLNLSF